MARPRIKIDQSAFEGLCRLQCTLEDIAAFFTCSEDTVERWCKRTYKSGFADVYKIYSAGGRISLRRTQFKLAEKSPAMAIWLGKQYLGQREKVEVQNSVNGKLAELIDGLREDDIYAKATASHGDVEDKQTPTDQHT